MMDNLRLNIPLASPKSCGKTINLHILKYSLIITIMMLAFISFSGSVFSQNKTYIFGSWIWNQKNLSIEALKKEGVDRVLTFHPDGSVETEATLGGGEPGFSESFTDKRGHYRINSNRLIIVGPSKLDPESGWPTGNKVDPVKYNCIFVFENPDTLRLSACPISGAWLRLPLEK